MHKGYTLNYFINYFSSIPDHQWCVGEEQKFADGDYQSRPTVQHCATGHAQRNARTTLDRTQKRTNMRLNALNSFLNDYTVDINDNDHRFSFLGKTPRGRILKALRNRQKYGSVFGKGFDQNGNLISYTANEDMYLSNYLDDDYGY
jgi:hypothetical protein